MGSIRGRKRNPICIGINEKYALTFIPIWNAELNITNYRLWVYVSFIIVITINAMISNLKGHYVCLIYFLGKLSISFPSEDLLSGPWWLAHIGTNWAPPLSGSESSLDFSPFDHYQAYSHSFTLTPCCSQPWVSLPLRADTMLRF